MALDFGTGVSRVLDPSNTSFQLVVWQAGKPPLDSELSLSQQIGAEWNRITVLRGVPSGWLGNAFNGSEDFLTNVNWSNWFRFGNQRTGEKKAIEWAVVNGWLVPVTGTQTGTPPGSPNDTDTWNKINLDPPPNTSGDARIDNAFLEVWLARIPPNPGTTNKPSAAGIWKYGNVEGGYTFIPDDLKDPAIGFETSQRIQVQYRIRVVSGLVGLSGYPDGFDPAVVKARGGATATTAFTFTNMRTELGDPGLWRAGDGVPTNALGTVDGYSYAVPLAAIFRRNTVAWDGDPSQNLNGGFNRNPTAIDRTGIKTFSTTPTLAANITASALSLTLVSATNIPLPTTPATPVTIQVGDEQLTYSVITGTTMTIVSRGVFGTRAETHRTGDVIRVISGRPDGLFSDQITKTDILDLRHQVNPNGFDYQALLRSNLDKLFRGKLRANWKLSGGGPQGSFIFYQDKISASPAALGVTKIDAPDNFRQVFSDAMMQQRIEAITLGNGTTALPIGPASVADSWSLAPQVFRDVGPLVTWAAGDVIRIPVAQFKTTLPGADADQAKIIGENWQFGGLTLRFGHVVTPLTPLVDYMLTSPDPSTPSDDLEITLLAGPGIPAGGSHRLHITFHVLYGPGRGLSRRPDSVHSVAYLSPSVDIMHRLQGLPTNNIPLSTAWAPLWSKFRSAVFRNMLPVTAESYADPGSRTVILSPFRRIDMPDYLATQDGNNINAPGGTQDLMPPLTVTGGAKWGTTDPFGFFDTFRYVTLPRTLLPGWGELRVPILHSDSSPPTFHEGINFAIMAKKGAILPNKELNYIPSSNGPITYAVFSNVDLNTGGLTALTFNTSVLYTGFQIGGARFFTDTRGLSRQGLEFPPFYGMARLFGVYEAQNYKTNGSPYDPTTRNLIGGPPGDATNLLRQDFTGPTYWIEIDSDGDSTFILNADAIDLARSPNAIANFGSGKYVVEASIFGFDRGTFDLTKPARIVLSDTRTQANPGTPPDSPTFDAPDLVTVAPAASGDQILVNYSKTSYQGDPWGSQTSGQDVGHIPGPLTTALMYQLISTELDESALTRPNQKPLEVLATTGFVTTLGTGRLAGDLDLTQLFDFRLVGKEDPAVFPPTSPIDPRPNLLANAFITGDDAFTLGTEYLGCTTRLPLGSTFRDKDFRGTYFESESPHYMLENYTPAISTHGLARDTEYDQIEVGVNTASASSGDGETIVHVDGEQGNYSLLTNFRVSRGGSLFTGSGPRPGGEVAASYIGDVAGENMIVGRAFLVRNTVTNVGASEKSAGDELMLAVLTTGLRKGSTILETAIGTQGTAEGSSAADLFHIEGRPIERDNVRFDLDPNTVVLSRKIQFP